MLENIPPYVPPVLGSDDRANCQAFFARIKECMQACEAPRSVSIPHYMDGVASAPAGGGFVYRAVGWEDSTVQASNYKILREVGQLDGVSFEEFLEGREAVSAAKKRHNELRLCQFEQMAEKANKADDPNFIAGSTFESWNPKWIDRLAILIGARITFSKETRRFGIIKVPLK